MSNMNIDTKKVVTGRVRLSYVHLINPRPSQQPGGKAKYGVTLLIPKSDIVTKQKIDAAIAAAINEGVTSKWNGSKPVQTPIPLHDGDGLKTNGDPFTPECKGHWVMTASSEHKPQVVDLSLNEILDQTQIYSGMYGRVSINFFPYVNSGKKGIGCGLINVQKLDDGEPLSGRSSAADDFGGGEVPSYLAPHPQYQQPPVQQYAPQAQYQQPPVQQYAPQPQYQQQQPPVQQQYQQPQQAPTQQPQQYQQQIDPITGAPIGGVMGL